MAESSELPTSSPDAHLIPTIETAKDDVSFKFIFTRHSGEKNAKLVLDALQDCDVIVLEQVGMRKKHKGEIQKIWNLLSLETPGSEDAKFLRNFFPQRNDEDGTFITKLVEGLTGSKKAVFLVDITEDSQQFAIYKQANEAGEKYSVLLSDKLPFSLSQALDGLSEYLELEAKAVGVREEFIASQLRTLHKFGSEEAPSPIKIGVVLGAAHTFVQHQLKREGYETQRVFAEGDALNSGYLYDLKASLIRTKRFFPDKPLDEGLLKRAVLIDLGSYVITTATTGVETNEEALEEAVKNLDSPTIEELWKVVKKTKSDTWRPLKDNPVTISKALMGVFQTYIPNFPDLAVKKVNN